MRKPICHCSRCHSQNTIRIHAERREHWYCYDCGRGFEVPIGDGTVVVSQGSTAPRLSPGSSDGRQLIGSVRETSLPST
jgi:hypothetical protein